MHGSNPGIQDVHGHPPNGLIIFLAKKAIVMQGHGISNMVGLMMIIFGPLKTIMLQVSSTLSK